VFQIHFVSLSNGAVLRFDRARRRTGGQYCAGIAVVIGMRQAAPRP
jgi:hypothetical protein